MWLAIDYILKTDRGNRYLRILSNYVTLEGSGIKDDGEYTITEDRTDFGDMNDEEIEDYREATYNWDNESFSGSETLGMLYIDLIKGYQYRWAGDDNYFTEGQLAQIVAFIITYKEPDAGGGW